MRFGAWFCYLDFVYLVLLLLWLLVGVWWPICYCWFGLLWVCVGLGFDLLFRCVWVGVLLVVGLDFVFYFGCLPMVDFVLVCFYNLGDSLGFGVALCVGLCLR